MKLNDPCLLALGKNLEVKMINGWGWFAYDAVAGRWSTHPKRYKLDPLFPVASVVVTFQEPVYGDEVLVGGIGRIVGDDDAFSYRYAFFSNYGDSASDFHGHNHFHLLLTPQPPSIVPHPGKPMLSWVTDPQPESLKGFAQIRYPV